MDIIPGLSQKHVSQAGDQAKKLIAKFDDNNDGKLSGEELKEKEVRKYTTTTSAREWYNEDFIKYTHTDKVEYDRIDETKLKAYDADKDGKLTAEEMVEAFMQESDKDKDGKVGFFERWFGRLPEMDDIFERTRTAITGQRTSVVYSPLPRDYDRPTPPGGSDYYNDRPTPPGGSSGGYNDRPTPPGGSSGSDRPTPPGGSSSGSRPTPPGGR